MKNTAKTRTPLSEQASLSEAEVAALEVRPEGVHRAPSGHADGVGPAAGHADGVGTAARAGLFHLKNHHASGETCLRV